MKESRQLVSFRMPLKLLELVRLISATDGVSVNQELIKLVELGIKTYMNKSFKNEDLILKKE